MSPPDTSDPHKAPEPRPRRKRRRIGLVIVNTGNGKGKTTAALGVLFRAWGRDFKVRMFQFIKHTGARFGENRTADRLGIPMEAFGDGFTWLSRDMDQTTAMAVALWDRCKEAILKGEEDIIVLDEFTYALHYGWVSIKEVVETLRQRPSHLHVIITGRHAPQELIDCADLVTEMKMIKHPYEEHGIVAQKGIEF